MLEKVTVEIAPDKMSAYLQILIHVTAKWPSFEEVMEEFKNAGVTYGIDTNLVMKILRDKNQDLFVIAEGTPEEKGEDAGIRFYFNPEPDPIPKELQDGSVDFKNINLVQHITKDTILLEKFPPTEGTPGKDVTGTVLKPTPGNDFKIVLGKNVEWEGNRIRATADGIPVMEGRKVEVRTVYEVRGNVDYKTGNINFDGDVLVKGDVQSDFLVEATGSIFVIGNIEGGSLKAAEDISVSGGIIGYGKSVINCVNLHTGYINNAIIEAQEEVKVRDTILNSQVNAGHKVTVKGKKGCIYGGIIRAGESIEAFLLGSKMGTATELEVGVKPGFRLEVEGIDKQLAEVEAGIDVLRMNMEGMDKRFLKLTPEQQKTKVAIVKNLQRYKGIQQELIARKNELLYDMKDFIVETGYLKAYQGIYPGVKIRIGKAVSLFKFKVPYSVLITCKKGEIVLRQRSSRKFLGAGGTIRM